MGAGISGVASVQLSVLQSPEVAREEAPVLLQAALANAQAPAIIERQDREAAETIQVLKEIQSRGVRDSLDGEARRERPDGRSARRSLLLQEKLVALAGVNARGMGELVDMRA